MDSLLVLRYYVRFKPTYTNNPLRENISRRYNHGFSKIDHNKYIKATSLVIKKSLSQWFLLTLALLYEVLSYFGKYFFSGYFPAMRPRMDATSFC